MICFSAIYAVPVPDDGEEWEEVEVDELGLIVPSVDSLMILMVIRQSH